MNTYSLPTSINIGDKERKIRNSADYRVILTVLEISRDEDLSPYERIFLSLKTFFADGDNTFKVSEVNDAYKAMSEFIDMHDSDYSCRNKPQRDRKPITDYVQDFPLYVGAVNAVLGYDIRRDEPTHWFTFINAHREIRNDCTYSKVLEIRDKKMRGQKLEKWEQQYIHENPHLFELRIWYTKEEWEFLNEED